MKQTASLVFSAALALTSPYLALAADAPAAAPAVPAPPAPEYTATSNVYIVSDYYFRGQTQTWHKPALQGGFDLSHASGLYVGTWLSNVSGNQYAGGSLEWDYYGGYNGKISDDLSWTAGGYGYYYPGANYSSFVSSTYPDQTYNTFEGNIGLTWKWIGVKYSRSFTDYFGANDKTGFEGSTKGTCYLEVNATYPVMDDLSVTGHFGITRFAKKYSSPVNGENDPSYNDLKLGITKTFKDGWAVGLALVKGSNSTVYGELVSANDAAKKEDIVKSRLILSVGRTF
jgi:uncharacterized protein (TIGR02001 family)